MVWEDEEPGLAGLDRLRVDESPRIVGHEAVLADEERGRSQLDRVLVAVPDVGRDRDLFERAEADHTGLEPNAWSPPERGERFTNDGFCKGPHDGVWNGHDPIVPSIPVSAFAHLRVGGPRAYWTSFDRMVTSLRRTTMSRPPSFRISTSPAACIL